MSQTRARTLRTAIASLFLPLALAAAMPQAAAADKPAKAAKPAVKTAAVKPSKAFDSWADRFAEDWVRANPQLATSTQYFEGAEQDALDRQLTPQTREQRRKMVDLAKAGVRAWTPSWPAR
jgi:predicted metal-dependent phosphoesterase TrpH